MKVGSPIRPATLFIGTTTDPASSNIVSHLLEKNQWENMPQVKSDDSLDCGTAYKIRSINEDCLYFLWMQNLPLLHLDCGDEKFSTYFDTSEYAITEALFLSKHAAASGTLSLTVHPIGIPWLTDASRSGGRPGRCSPPNPRIASIYREILKTVKMNNLHEEYQVTMEATHHGPYMQVPSCFIEIGSTDSCWTQPRLGDIWASCLSEYFALPPRPVPPHHGGEDEGPVSPPAPISSLGASPSVDSEPSESSPCSQSQSSQDMSAKNGVVVIGIGGGHYVPRLNDLARLGTGLFIGHMLASYTLEKYFSPKIKAEETEEKDEEEEEEGWGWQHIISEAISSTRISFPNHKLVCIIDKKGFNASGRTALTQFLESERVQWTYKSADVKKIWESNMSKSCRDDMIAV